MSRFNTGLPSDSANRQIASGYQLLSATGATDWVKFVNCDIAIAVSGSATSCIATVQRSSTDPASDAGAHTAPADNTGFTGDLTAGLAAPAPRIYCEPGVGWWRVNVATLTGGTVTVSLTGIGG